MGKYVLVPGLALGALMSLTTSAGSLYRWVDKDGRVTFQDHPPPGEQYEQLPLERLPAGKPPAGKPKPVVVLYAAPNCASCDGMRKVLQDLGLSFDEIDPSGDQVAIDKMVERFGQAQVPITVVDGKVIRGLSPLWLRATLEELGYLKPATQKEAVEGS